MQPRIIKTFKTSDGFTIIEILVTMMITVFLTIILVFTFSKSKYNIDLVANSILSDIRSAQTKTLTGARYNTLLRCGYGIHYLTNATYAIYVGPQPNVSNGFCTSLNRNYRSNEDTDIATKILMGSYSFKTNWAGGSNGGIFFQPPNPTTYIDESANLNKRPEEITIMPSGSAPSYCSNTATKNKCRTICVYTSGKLTIIPGEGCP